MPTDQTLSSSSRRPDESAPTARAEATGLARTALILGLGFAAGLAGKALIGGFPVMPAGAPLASTAETIAVEWAEDDLPANVEGSGNSPVLHHDVTGPESSQVAPATGTVRPTLHSAIDPDLVRELNSLDDEVIAASPTSRTSRAIPFFSDGADGNDLPVADGDARPHGPSPPSAPSARSTLGHWNRVNGIIDREAAMRSAPADGVTAANAGDFLERRIDAGRFAAEAIRALPQTGVDPALVEFSERLAAWYEKGATICEKGQWLLEKASDTARKGPEGKAWQKNDKEHQASVNGLNRDGEALRRKLAAKYGVSFPKLH